MQKWMNIGLFVMTCTAGFSMETSDHSKIDNQNNQRSRESVSAKTELRNVQLREAMVKEFRKLKSLLEILNSKITVQMRTDRYDPRREDKESAQRNIQYSLKLIYNLEEYIIENQFSFNHYKFRDAIGNLIFDIRSVRSVLNNSFQETTDEIESIIGISSRLEDFMNSNCTLAPLAKEFLKM